MRAAMYERYGPPEVVHLAEVATPEPRPGEILVRVHASVVGASDVAARSGSPWFARLAFGLARPKMPVLGTEFVGTVTSRGANATRFAVGDRVFGATGIAAGTNAEFAVVREDGAIALAPEGVPDAEAVAAIDAMLTAMPFLRDACRVRPRQRVLVHGAAGTVGGGAVQLAKLLGAHVTATTSAANTELVRSLGADDVIDRRVVDFARADATYDVVFDAVGKSSFGVCRRILAPRGVYASTVPGFGLLLSMLGTTIVRRRRATITFTGLRKDSEKAEDLEQLRELLESRRFRGVVDRVVPFEQIRDAHARVDSGRKTGAVVVELVPSRVGGAS